MSSSLFSFEELLARSRSSCAGGQAKWRAQRSLLMTYRLTSPGITRGDTPIKLSHTEYALLEYLLRNKNRVLSKTNIINHVWDFDADVLQILLKRTSDTYAKNHSHCSQINQHSSKPSTVLGIKLANNT